MQTSKLTVKGQVTIPLDIRRLLMVEAGSQVGFDVLPEGGVILVKVNNNKSIAGVLKNKISNTAAVSIEDMNQVIKAGWQADECD